MNVKLKTIICLFLMLTTINNLMAQVGNNLASDNATGELGDVNNDGTIDIIDALLVSQYYVELNPDGFNPEAADVDCNESIDIVDALLISQYYVFLINVFPCPTPVPAPPKIMIVSAHPDDEGIFFGGTIPYYTQVLKVPTVHISMTSGDYISPPEVREIELTNADTVYYGREITTSIGLSPGTSADLFFPRFKDFPTSTLDETWDWWYDNIPDNGDAGQGKQKAIDTIATYIRILKPEVIVTHDLDGEGGHYNHNATAIAVNNAYDRAADPAYVDGYESWLVKKLYIHQSQDNGLGTNGYTFINWLFHDFWEDYTIDTTGNNIADKTPRQVADLGLDEHITQGCPDVSTVYRTNENFNGHHSEWWGLLRSRVGPDTIANDFTIRGYYYSGWALGNFFENLR